MPSRPGARRRLRAAVTAGAAGLALSLGGVVYAHAASSSSAPAEEVMDTPASVRQESGPRAAAETETSAESGLATGPECVGEFVGLSEFPPGFTGSIEDLRGLGEGWATCELPD